MGMYEEYLKKKEEEEKTSIYQEFLDSKKPTQKAAEVVTPPKQTLAEKAKPVIEKVKQAATGIADFFTGGKKKEKIISPLATSKEEIEKPEEVQMSKEDYVKSIGYVQQQLQDAEKQKVEFEKEVTDLRNKKPTIQKVGEFVLGKGPAVGFGISGRNAMEGPEINKRLDAIDNLSTSIELYKEFLNVEQVDRGFFQGLWKKAKKPGETFVPFASDVKQLGEVAMVWKITKDIEKGVEPDKMELALLNKYRSMAIDKVIDRGMGYKVGDVVVQLPSFALSFYLTGGIYAGAKVATVKVVEKVAMPKVLAKVTGWAVGSLAQSAAFVPTIANRTADYMIPDAEFIEGKNGELIIKAAEGKGDPFEKAISKAFLTNYLDVATERLGVLVEEPLSFLQKAVLGKFAQKLAITSSKELKNIAAKIGWNGIVGEVFEEEISELGQAPVEERKYYAPFVTPQGTERLLVETLGIGAFGGIGKVGDMVFQKVYETQQKLGQKPLEIPVQETETPVMPKVITEAIEKKPVEEPVKPPVVYTKPQNAPKTIEEPKVVSEAIEEQKAPTKELTPVTFEEKSTPIEKASTIYSDLLKTSTPNEKIDTVQWKEQMQEQVDNPERYHPIAEDENPKGLKIGDVVRVTDEKFGDYNGYVVSVQAEPNAPAYKGGYSVNVIQPGSYGGFVEIDAVNKVSEGKVKAGPVALEKLPPVEIPEYDKTKVSEVFVGTPMTYSGRWDTLQERLETYKKPLENRIETIKNELKQIQSDRSKESVAKKKSLREEQEQLQNKINEVSAQVEETAMDFNMALGLQAMQQAEKMGLDLGKIGDGYEDVSEKWQEFRDDFLTRLTERPYIETNWETPVDQILKEMVAEYKGEEAPPKEEPKKPAPVKEEAKPAPKKVSRKPAAKPKVSVERVYSLISKPVRSLPILNNVQVKDGMMNFTDLETSVSIPTDLEDGIYEMVGKDLIKTVIPMEDFPVVKPEGTPKAVADALTDTLTPLFKRALISASKDETRPILTGALVEIKGGTISVTTTDGYRLYHETGGVKGIEDTKFILGGLKNVASLMDLLSEERVHILEGKDHVTFDNDNGQITVRKLEGEYPNFAQIFPEYKKRIRVSKKSWLAATKEIAPYIKDSANTLKVTVTDSEVILSGQRPESAGGAKKEVTLKIFTPEVISTPKGGLMKGSLIMPVRIEVEEVPEGTFALNNKYATDVANQFEGDDLYIDLTDNNLAPVHFSDEKESVITVVKPPEPIKLTPEEEKIKKWIKSGNAPSGSSASMDKFADLENLTNSLSRVNAVEFPELLRIAKELMGGVPVVKRPRFRPMFGGYPLGLFVGVGKGQIQLNPDIFKDPVQAAKTFAHEMGHLTDYIPEGTLKRGNLVGRIATLQKNMGSIEGIKDKEVRAELKKLTQLWKPFDEETSGESFIKYRYSAKEMYADAISILFNDPELLKTEAPIFWKGFFDYIDNKPEAKENFFQIWNLLNQGEEAVLTEREKDIRGMFKKGEDLYKAKLIERAQKDNNFLFRLKYEIIDKNQAVIDLVEKAKKDNKFIPDDKNPVYWLEGNNYVGGKVKAYLEKNIQPIYMDIKQGGVTWEDFGEVLFLERVIKERGATANPIKDIRSKSEGLLEGALQDFMDQNQDKLPADVAGISASDFLDRLEKKGADEQFKMINSMFEGFVDVEGNKQIDEVMKLLPKGLANPLGYDVQSAQKQRDYLEKQMGPNRWDTLQRNLPKYRAAIKSVLADAVESELYGEEIVKEMMANPAYATYQVLDYLDVYIPASVKHQIGTLKGVANPATSTVMKTISIIRAIERNRAKRSIVQFLKKNFPEEIKDARTMWTGKTKIPIDSKESDEALFTLMEEGRYKGYYVDPYIAATMETMGTGHVNAVTSVLRFFNSKMFRPLFITFNVGFQTFNLMRDFMRFYKNTPNMSLLRAVKRYGEALPAAHRRAWDMADKTIQEMEEKKILSVTYNDVIAGMTENDKQIDLILQKVGLSPLGAKKTNIFFKIPLGILDTIAKFGNFIETIPKVAGYRELQGKLPSQEMASFVRTSIGSPDFLRRGAGYSWYNELFLFSNSIKEGIRADYNVAFRNPRTRSGFWWKTGLVTFLPKMVMFAGLMGLFGEAIKKMLEDISEYDKTNYTVVPLGKDKNGMTTYLRVPQDETGRLLGGIMWKAMRIANNNKPVMQDITDLLSYTGGQLPSLTPTVETISTTAQFLAGQNPYDFFRGYNVIPDQEFEAGGMYALKPFLTWQFNQMGGGVFQRFYTTQQSPATKTWVQKVIDAPVISNILGRWIKVSNQGQKEKNRTIIDKTSREEAKTRLENKELINDAVKEYNSGEQSMTRRLAIERKLVLDVVGEGPYKDEKATAKTNTIKKFHIAVIKGEADANINSIISATTNEQKFSLLQEMNKQMEKAEFKEMTDLLVKEKIISKELMRRVNKELQSMAPDKRLLAYAGDPADFATGKTLALSAEADEYQKAAYDKLKNWTRGEASYYNPTNPEETRPNTNGVGAYGRMVEPGSVAFGNRVFHDLLKSGEKIYVQIKGMEDVKTPYGNGVFRIDDTMNESYSNKGQFNIDFNAADLDQARKSKGRFPIQFRIIEPGQEKKPQKDLRIFGKWYA